MSYDYETSDIPVLFILRPTYDTASTAATINTVTGQFNYAKRMKNNSSPWDVADQVDTRSFTIDMFDNSSQVTVGGTTLSYRQVSAFIKKIGDVERAKLT
jgi:hypothetical protein